MPEPAIVAANKANSEARKLLLKLQLTGHTTADIARALGTEAEKLRNIRKGATRGDQWIIPLQRLMGELRVPANTPAPANPTGGTTAAEAPGTPPVETVATPAGGTLPQELGAVEAPDMEPPAPPGLAARLKSMMLGGADVGGASAPVARSGGKGKSELQAQFVAQVLPVLSLVVAWGCELAIKDPYKPVAPTVQEASAILTVPIRRVARELDIRQKLTEGTMDMVLMLLAVAAYGRRAQATYRTIRSEHDTQAKGASSGARTGASTGVSFGPESDTVRSASYPGGYLATPAAVADDRASGASTAPANDGRRGFFGRGSQRPGSGGAAVPDGRTANGASRSDAVRHAGGAASAIDDLLRRDYEGRVQRGMVG